MYILGLSYNYHDAAACLVRDGVPVAAVEEERFSRRKHDPRFPQQAIAYCLRQAGIGAGDLAGVAFYEKPLRKLERLLGTAALHRGAEAPAEMVAGEISGFLHESLLVEQLMAAHFGYTGKVYYSEHHLSHAASAFYPSPFAEAAVLTVDGVGEWATTAEFMGSAAGLTALREIRYPHSLGLLYSAMTAYLGFRVNDDEYKVMGLASYGQPTLKHDIDRLLTLHDDGSYALDMQYFSFDRTRARMFTDALVDLLGPARHVDDPIETRHQAIAASLQLATEEAMLNLTSHLARTSGAEHLCMAGGVAYNCVANSRVQQSGAFKRVWVQPAAGDSGCAMGAALEVSARLSGGARRGAGAAPMPHSAYLGPSFTDAEIEEKLIEAGLDYDRHTPESLCAATASLLHRNFIIGWFQGRMEFGPRALGSRSILANPCNPDMKDILNARVKFREEFRPFAPAVLKEAADVYFEMFDESPYMLFTPRVREGMGDKIPSVTHVDGTARVQTVTDDTNPLFYQLLQAFGALSGTPVLINTSFNVRGEPIVTLPENAIYCFLHTDIDFLVIGNFIVRK